MAYFKIPTGLKPEDWSWVSASGEAAQLLDLPQLQADLYRRYPELKTACVALPRKSRGFRGNYFRAVLQPREDQKGKIRVFFSVYGSRPHQVVRAMTHHWRNKGIPWVRVLCSDGDSTHLPDWSFNDSLYAA